MYLDLSCEDISIIPFTTQQCELDGPIEVAPSSDQTILFDVIRYRETKERDMYGGKGLGVVNTAAGISLLPDTGNNNVLFVLAASLLVSGFAIFVAATIVARKSQGVQA